MHKKLKAGSIGIDLEDYYHVSAFENILSDKDKKSLPSLVVPATDIILSILDEYNIKATFFCLGYVAQDHPELIQKIANNGHEISAHSMYHKRIYHMDEASFFEDTKNVKSLLEGITGQSVIGYRAPSFSINHKTDFFYDVLETLGFKYSSSLHPIKHDHYGDVNAPKYAFYPDNSNILEIPVSVAELGKKRIPFGGGGWFRLMPYFMYKIFAKQIIADNQPLIFYSHPWEFMPDQPVIDNISIKTKFRHYVGLGRMKQKFTKLCRDYEWQTMKDIYFK